MTATQRATKPRVFALGLLLAVGLVMSGLAARSVHATMIFTVDSSGDGPDVDVAINNVCDADPAPNVSTCTLRGAIEQANATAGADIIWFNIPGSGVRTISPVRPCRRYGTR